MIGGADFPWPPLSVTPTPRFKDAGLPIPAVPGETVVRFSTYVAVFGGFIPSDRSAEWAIYGLTMKRGPDGDELGADFDREVLLPWDRWPDEPSDAPIGLRDEYRRTGTTPGMMWARSLFSPGAIPPLPRKDIIDVGSYEKPAGGPAVWPIGTPYGTTRSTEEAQEIARKASEEWENGHSSPPADASSSEGSVPGQPAQSFDTSAWATTYIELVQGGAPQSVIDQYIEAFTDAVAQAVQTLANCGSVDSSVIGTP